MKFLAALFFGLSLLVSCGEDEKKKEKKPEPVCEKCVCQACECDLEGVCSCPACECEHKPGERHSDDGDVNDDQGGGEGGCSGGTCG